MPHASPLPFTLREDGARSSYRVQAGADRLRMAVSFDDEDTGDLKSVITPFSFASPTAARPAVPQRAFAPQVAQDDDEITDVTFALPACAAR